MKLSVAVFAYYQYYATVHCENVSYFTTFCNDFVKLILLFAIQQVFDLENISLLLFIFLYHISYIFCVKVKDNKHNRVYNFIDGIVSQFSYEIDNWIKFGNETQAFQHLLNSLSLPTNLQRNGWRSLTAEAGTAICIVCESILNTFMTLRKNGMSAEDIGSKVAKLCTRLNLQTERVCNGTITINLVSKVHFVI